MRLEHDEAAFLVVCLRFLAEDAPCQTRIEQVVTSVIGPDSASASHLPDRVYARSLALAAVLWAVDSGIVSESERSVARRVLETVWGTGPIRPQLIAAQLRCLAGQDAGSAHCRWTCPSMIRANEGYSILGDERATACPDDGRASAFPGLDPLPDVVLRISSQVRPPGPQGAGARVRCSRCGLPGRLVGIDPDDGWTLVAHGQAGTTGRFQCRYLPSDLLPLAAPEPGAEAEAEAEAEVGQAGG